ncbi:hypothetical protein [Nonomuraea sp. NPDC005650]|uniref:hypothetical protein n=1 Tax=Nonomuraea sp. NPDC005650 TaxID=3157045 RepID=UPI0033AA30F8
MTRILAVLLALLATACSADLAPARPSPTASTPQAGPGRYTRLPDPCSLLTIEQAQHLVPLGLPNYSETGCLWSLPGHVSLPASSVYTLLVDVHVAADVTAARTYFKQPVTSPAMDPWEQVQARAERLSIPAPGVGDESAVYQMTTTTYMIYRLSNAMIALQYSRDEEADPRQRDNLQKAALWTAEVMGRPAPAANAAADGRFAAAPYACSLLADGSPGPATACHRKDASLTVRHAPPWNGKSGLEVAKEMFAYYRKRPAKTVKGLGDEAFRLEGTLWVRVSNLVLEVRSPDTTAVVRQILDRLPDG